MLKVNYKEGGQRAQMQEVRGTCSMHFDIEIGIRIGTTWQLMVFKSLTMGIVHVCNIYVCAYTYILIHIIYFQVFYHLKSKHHSEGAVAHPGH